MMKFCVLFLLICATNCLTAQVTVKTQYETQVKVKEKREFGLSTYYVNELGGKELVQKGDRLYYKLVKSCNEKEVSKASISLASILSPSDCTSDILSDLNRSSLRENISILRGPIEYTLDLDQLYNDFSFHTENVSQLKPYVKDIVYTIYIIGEYINYELKLRNNLITEIKHHSIPYPFFVNCRSIGDYAQVQYWNVRGKSGVDGNNLVQSINAYLFNHYLIEGIFLVNTPRHDAFDESLSTVKSPFDQANVLEPEEFETIEAEKLFLYNIKTIDIRDAKLEGEFEACYSNLPILSETPDYRLRRLILKPRSFLKKVKDSFSKDRLKELAKKEEKVLLWYTKEKDCSYVSSILLSTYKNSVMEKEEVISILNSFSRWSSNDFESRDPEGEISLIIDFAKLRDLVN